MVITTRIRTFANKLTRSCTSKQTNLFMKKNFLLAVAFALLVTVVTLFVEDGWIYGIAGLMAATVFVVMRSFNSKFLKLTRWAKSNPRKTQVLIGILQILIVCLALLIGYDLKELGYKLTEVPAIISGIILVWAFFSIRFLPKQNLIAIPAAVNKDRIAYMGIVLSSFVILVIAGNRVEDKFPNSPISIALRTVDHRIFGDDFSDAEDYTAFESNQGQANLISGNTPLIALASTGTEASSPEPDNIIKKGKKDLKKAEKLEQKKKKMMKRVEKLRKMGGAWATVGTVLLIIFLVGTTCAGICLIAIGGSAGAVIGGVVLLGLSIFGFVKLLQKKKKLKEEQ